MIESHVHLYTDNGMTVELQISVVEDSGAGIKRVALVDRDGIEFYIEDRLGQNCPSEFTFETRGIPNTRFPIFVRAHDCDDNWFENEPIPLQPRAPIEVGGPGIQRGCSPLICEEPSPNCITALTDLEGVRRQITLLCAEIAALIRRRNAYLIASITLLIASVVCFVLAAVGAAIPFIGQGAVALLLVAGAVLLAASIAMGVAAAVVQGQIADKERELGQLQGQFLDHVALVHQNCCVPCVSNDLSLPTCG